MSVPLHLVLVGSNHRTAPVAAREWIAARLQSAEAGQGQFESLAPPLFVESLRLVTCNRAEIYGISSDPAQAEYALRAIFQSENNTPAAGEPYTLFDRDAVGHLLAVAGGIDSMVLGEFEILGQVRRAYRQAAAAKTVGPLLHQLFQTAGRLGKRARSETEISAGATSVASAAVAHARSSMGELKGRVALVIGAGEMGERAARHLTASGATVWVSSRTRTRATKLAQRVGGQVVPATDLADAVAHSDIVISASSAPHHLLDVQVVAGAMQRRPTRQLLLIDLAVPRDIDPLAESLDNVSLVNLDHLQTQVACVRATRAVAVAQVQTMIDEEVEAFWDWLLERRAGPVIQELYARAEALRQVELERALKQLDHLTLSEHERNVVATLSTRLVNKMLAAPTANLKTRVHERDGQVYLEAVRALFEL